MRAGYDSKAEAISIALVPGAHAERADSRHPRAIVALRRDQPVELQLLYPDLGLEEPLNAVAKGYDLDPGELIAAAEAALAMPDQEVAL
jgi:hypothetical protein